MWKMNPWLCTAGLLILAAGCQRVSLDRPEGDWAGFAFSPGGEVVDMTYHVTSSADSFLVTLDTPDGEIAVPGFQIEEEELTFSLNPGFEIDCRLLREEDGLYKGGCVDGESYVGPMVLAPPGRSVVAEDLDMDKVFEVWDLSRAEYERMRYGRRESERVKLERMLDEAPPGRRVEVEGTTMHLVEQGEGDVTVVLEAGLGDDHQVWRQLQGTLAEGTRVVAYDRAGLGRSEASDAPRTPAQIADELHAMLHAADVLPPYVLVGHEAGALHVRAFSARYPDAVAGLVLIDPAHEHLGDRWQGLDADAWSSYLQQKQDFYAALPGAIGAEFEAYATLLENGQFPEASPLPDVPTVVITGARPAEVPAWVGETPEGVQAKQDVHAAWAGQLAQGTHLVTENAGSYVHHEDPEIVLRAVQEVLEAVRQEP